MGKQNNAWPVYKSVDWDWHILMPFKGTSESGILKWNNSSTISGITNKTSSNKNVTKKNK